MIDTRSRYFHRSAAGALLAAALCAAAVLFAGAGADAFELRGRVTNMTTGELVASIPLSVVDPRHGVATEGEIRTDAAGAFVVPALSDEISVYLIQLTHSGVTYTQMVRPAEGTVEVDVSVYDTTTSWDSVRVSIPHFMARRSDDTLSVDRMFSVVNNTSPPRTIVGEGAGFRLFVPRNRLQITALFATTLGIPISVEPHPTESPDFVTVDYPFKPGETRVGVSFDVAYAGERYEYEEPLQYAVDEVVVMKEDPGMEVTSGTLSLGEPEEIRGFQSYRLANLPRSSILALKFRGGESRAQPAEGETGHEVVILREPWQDASVVLIVGFALLLVLVMAFATKSPLPEKHGPAVLAERKDSLLTQIARLDDLYEMGTVPEPLHKAKRRDLVDELALIVYRLDKLEPGRSGPGKSAAPRKGKGTTHDR
jgi:hypothetical protein